MASFKIIALMVCTALLVLAVSCGGDTPSQESPTKAPASSSSAQAKPAPTSAPAKVEKAQTVRVMNGTWSNELWTPRDGVGENAAYGRQLHAYWISGDENVKMQPAVLTDWKVSADGLSWDLTIRDGIKFHNGEEFTVDDALFTLDFDFGAEAIEKSISPSLIAEAEDTESYEITGPNTLRITHKSPKAYFPFFMSELSFGIAGVVLPEDYLNEVGQDGYNSAPIGAGPFRLLEHKIAEHMKFERYEDYFNADRIPSFSNLEMYLVPEVSTRVAALRADQTDIIEANLTVGDQIVDGGGRLVWASESSYMWMILPNCDLDVFCNKKEVRQALDYAIDKNLIVDELYGGGAATAKGWVYVTPSALGYTPDLDPWPYDVAKAQSLLAAAGYPDGKGAPKFNIYTWNAGDLPYLPEQAQLIADMWKKNLGLEVDVVVGEAATTREKWYAGELAGHVLLRSNEARWDGGSITNALYGQWEGRAHIGGKREDTKAAAHEAMAVVDPSLRQAAFEKTFKFLFDEHYEFGSGYVNLPWGVGPRIKSWNPWPVVPYQTAMWTVELN